MASTGTGDWAQRDYRLGLAKLSVEGLFGGDHLGDDLAQSWKPGATVTRYRRRWHLTKPHEGTAPGFVAGEIGFVREGDVTTVSFDPGTQEFRRDTTSSGSISPFIIRLSDGLVVYQLRPGIIRDHTFTGALEDLLNSSGQELLWSVNPATELVDWPVWLEGIAAVTSFKVRLERPNPHYGDDFKVEEMVEDLRAQYVTLAARAREGESLDTSDDLFTQALDHVLANYGSATVVGRDAAAHESVWMKAKKGLGQVTRRRTVQAAGPDETPVPVLQQVAASETTQYVASREQYAEDLGEEF